MLRMGISPVELVLRVMVVYVAFLIALRMSGKRELGQFTIFDLALVLLAANALQPAMTGPDASLPGAAIIIATIFVLNRVIAFLRRRVPLVKRLLEFPPAVVGRDGHWIDKTIDREDLDEEDLDAALREHGLESVEQMRLAVLEPDGSISIVPEDGAEITLRSRRRRYRRHRQD